MAWLPFQECWSSTLDTAMVPIIQKLHHSISGPFCPDCKWLGFGSPLNSFSWYLLVWIPNQNFWSALIEKDIKHCRIHILSLVNQENVVRADPLKVRPPKLVSFLSRTIISFTFFYSKFSHKQNRLS